MRQVGASATALMTELKKTALSVEQYRSGHQTVGASPSHENEDAGREREHRCDHPEGQRQ